MCQGKAQPILVTSWPHQQPALHTVTCAFVSRLAGGSFASQMVRALVPRAVCLAHAAPGGDSLPAHLP